MAQFDSIEDIAGDAVDNPNNWSIFEQKFLLARNWILRKLWEKNIFIGASIIEELLFGSLKDASIPNPATHVFELIRRFGLHRPGFILYPLHSLGITGGAGLLGFLQRKRLSIVIPEANLAISPQSNSKEALIEFLENATVKLRIKRKLPSESIDHYLRLGLDWLTKNPLLLLRVRTFTNENFGHQFVLTLKLKLAASLISILYSLQKNDPARRETRLFSTSRMNNWQTFDISHYIVFEPALRRHRKFTSQRVPMNVARAELADLSELNVEFNPTEWRSRPRLFAKVIGALQKVEVGYLAHCVGQRDNSVHSRVFRKILLALDYFRRSFHESSREEELIIRMATAYEILLTDSYASGVTGRIGTRFRILLRGVNGSRKMKKAAVTLYNARSEGVHRGEALTSVDWPSARLAFVHALVVIVQRLPRLRRIGTNFSEPMAFLIGN